MLIQKDVNMDEVMISQNEFRCGVCDQWTEILLPEEAWPRVSWEQEAGRHRGSSVVFHEHLGDEVHCLPAMVKGVELQPESADAHFIMGTQYNVHCHPGKARDSFRKATLLDPTLADAHLYLARTYQEDAEMFYQTLLAGSTYAANWRWYLDRPEKDFQLYCKLMTEAAIATGNPQPALSPGKVLDRRKKVGRNQPCPCGSGKKYKKCCG